MDSNNQKHHNIYSFITDTLISELPNNLRAHEVLKTRQIAVEQKEKWNETYLRDTKTVQVSILQVFNPVWTVTFALCFTSTTADEMCCEFLWQIV